MSTIENNKNNGFEGKIMILRPNGDIQEAVGNTEVVGFKKERSGKQTQISRPSATIMDATAQERCLG